MLLRLLGERHSKVDQHLAGSIRLEDLKEPPRPPYLNDFYRLNKDYRSRHHLYLKEISFSATSNLLLFTYFLIKGRLVSLKSSLSFFREDCYEPFSSRRQLILPTLTLFMLGIFSIVSYFFSSLHFPSMGSDFLYYLAKAGEQFGSSRQRYSLSIFSCTLV